MSIQTYVGGHAPFPFTCSVRHQTVHKIAVTDGKYRVHSSDFILHLELHVYDYDMISQQLTLVYDQEEIGIESVHQIHQ